MHFYTTAQQSPHWLHIHPQNCPFPWGDLHPIYLPHSWTQLIHHNKGRADPMSHFYTIHQTHRHTDGPTNGIGNITCTNIRLSSVSYSNAANKNIHTSIQSYYRNFRHSKQQQ